MTSRVAPVSRCRSNSRSRIALPGRRVEIAGRLVGEEQGRARRGRPGDGDPLLLAAGQLGGIMGETVAEADRLQLGPGEVERSVPAGQLERNGDILERGHRRKQMEGLEDDPDPALPGAGEIVLAQSGEIRAGDPDRCRRSPARARKAPPSARIFRFPKARARQRFRRSRPEGRSRARSRPGPRPSRARA